LLFGTFFTDCQVRDCLFRTLLTTEECLLHPSRNPRMNKAQIEQMLKEYTSVHKVQSPKPPWAT
jgi:hypothetical protein